MKKNDTCKVHQTIFSCDVQRISLTKNQNRTYLKKKKKHSNRDYDQMPFGRSAYIRRINI